MKLAFLLSSAVASVARVSASHLDASVTQTFFIPLPEKLLLDECFTKINIAANQTTSLVPNKPITNMISITISADETVIFYDHHEDGYEYDHSNPEQSTTEIWGDHNATNGCAPTIVGPCTDDDDILTAGTSIVITQDVPTQNRYPSEIYYDGGDRIGSSHPISITRGGFPVVTGSRMAGAVEVLSNDYWGLNYEAPVGKDVNSETMAFQFVALFVMSGADDNQVTYQTGGSSFDTVTLNMGESIAISVKQAWTVEGTKPLQVDLLTGDRNSAYETRWFSLLAAEFFAKSYLSPVGETKGRTRIVLYNPGTSQIQVDIAFLLDIDTPFLASVHIEPKSHALTLPIPSGSGCKVSSDHVFLALSFTDTEIDNTLNETTFGQAYDWGFPLLPIDMLTSQVLIGMGFGCTHNLCNPSTKKIMSVVWVSPVSNADIYVDYDNDGDVNDVFYVKELQGLILKDGNDTDMSGALIFATQPGSGEGGTPVKIAAAWGQNPLDVELTIDDQDRSLDLGTVVVPLPNTRVPGSCSSDHNTFVYLTPLPYKSYTVDMDLIVPPFTPPPNWFNCENAPSASPTIFDTRAPPHVVY